MNENDSPNEPSNNLAKRFGGERQLDQADHLQGRTRYRLLNLRDCIAQPQPESDAGNDMGV